MVPERELTWLRRVRDLSHLLATVRRVDELLPLILDAGIELTGAERGFLVRVLPGKRGRRKIKVEIARGFDQVTLQSPETGVSRTVVKRVLELDRGLVTSEEEWRDVLQVSSVEARRVRAILCVPLRLRGENRGVLYLDHRFDAGAFSAQDLPVLQTFAEQAALALETAELRTLRGSPAGSSGLRPPPVPGGLGRLVGVSPPMLVLYEEIERIARTDAPALIVGESGTGKELVAREIHDRSARSDGPFVAASCLADPAVFARELLGEKKGPRSEVPGLMVRAAGGTLFLDAISELESELQTKLLAVLEQQRVYPIGGATSAPLRCRLVVASREDLKARVDRGQFRADLFYRLDVMRLTLPPLRRRPGDVPLLFQHFVSEAGETPVRLTADARARLEGYSWPGNALELRNETRRLLALGLPEITADQLSPEVREPGTLSAGPAYGGKTMGQVEREMIVAALRACGGNKAQAARQLGIPRSTLYHLLERHGVE